MDEVRQLDELLGADTDSNYWSDYAVLDASDMLRTLRRSQFDQLVSMWPAKPAKWQRRLADVLGDGDPELVIPVLIDMIMKGDETLAASGADTLRVQLQDARSQPRFTADLVERLEDLTNHADGLMRQSLTSLLERLKRVDEEQKH